MVSKYFRKRIYSLLFENDEKRFNRLWEFYYTYETLRNFGAPISFAYKTLFWYYFDEQTNTMNFKDILYRYQELYGGDIRGVSIPAKRIEWFIFEPESKEYFIDFERIYEVMRKNVRKKVGK
ncbi:MAG: hypothetical protein QXU98_12675, partial [Candidatus Parvarchaeota archaeon]